MLACSAADEVAYHEVWYHGVGLTGVETVDATSAWAVVPYKGVAVVAMLIFYQDYHSFRSVN